MPAGFTLVSLDSVESTNEEALRLARSGAPAGSVVWARRQTAGRGRRGRAWDSPAGNLYCSVVLRPRSANAAQVSFVAAIAVADALAALGCRVAPTLKWPNDVLMGGRKIGGILLESSPMRRDEVAVTVVGTGVNVATHPDDGSTALRNEGVDVEVETVLSGYLRHLALWLERWQGEGFAPVRTAWLDRATGVGTAIEVRLHTETLPGVFTGLDEDGVLLLETASGLRRISAGDVFLTDGQGREHAARH